MPENRRTFPQLNNGKVPGPKVKGQRPSSEIPTLDIRSGTLDRHVRAETSFAARFGTAIAEYGLAAVPAALYHHQGKLGLSAQEVWFVSYVLSHKWGEDLPRPSLKQLQKCSGLSDRTVQRYRERLEEAGYLQVETRFHTSGRQSECAYDFSSLFEALEGAIEDDTRPLNPIHADGEAENQDKDKADETSGQPDRSFVARYGSVLAKRGVAVIPRALFLCMGALKLTPQQVWFISYIFSFQWTSALPYPSILKMAARTGYSKVQLHDIKGTLVDKGYLHLVHRSTKDGGRDSNAYDFSGLFDAILAQMKKEESAQDKNEATPTQAVSNNSTAAQLRYARRGGRAAKQGKMKTSNNNLEGDKEFTGLGGTESLLGRRTKGLPARGDREFTGEGDAELTASVEHPSPTRGTKSLPGRGNVTLYEEESIKEDSQYRVDSNQLAKNGQNCFRENKKDNPKPSFSPYIASIITDFSDELNDPDHITSNATQALRVWTQSGLGEQEFAELLFEARKTVRRYQSKQGLRTIENKMGYFFRVLRQLVEDS